MSTATVNTKLKIETISMKDLDIRRNNPNRMSDERFESLQYSMEKFDYVSPIMVNQDNIIVDGAHRYNALKEMGADQVDVVRVFTKNEEELKLLSQTMNKLRGEHDLKEDISEMELLMGYNPIELQSLLGFDETGLDLMRQRAASEQEQISNMNSIDKNEKEDVEFKASLKHQCPNCGHLFN